MAAPRSMHKFTDALRRVVSAETSMGRFFSGQCDGGRSARRYCFCRLACPERMEKSRYNNKQLIAGSCSAVGALGSCRYPGWRHRVSASHFLESLRLLTTTPTQNSGDTRQSGSSSPIERKDKVLTVPNLLSALRIALSPCLGYLVIQEMYVPCAALFGFAFFTDWLDGWIARNWSGQRSMLGTVLDPLGDKILVATLTLSLTAVNIIPMGLTALIVLRDVGLISCSVYIKFKSLSQPRTLYKFLDFENNKTVEFQPSLLSKINTAIQMSLIINSLLAPIFGFVDHAFLHFLWYLTGTTTVLSGFGYVFKEGNRKIA